jgi:UDP-2,3-diacylglucosamine hydrolase
MLSHGDIFCIDDLDYQNFKNTVRSEKWKTNFLSKDLSERNAIAKKLREESAQKNLEKKAFLMDVNKGEVNRVAQKYDIDILIHGHVHRPKTHIEDYGTRIVLGDWDRKYWFITLIDQEVNLISGKVK